MRHDERLDVDEAGLLAMLGREPDPADVALVASARREWAMRMVDYLRGEARTMRAAADAQPTKALKSAARAEAQMFTRAADSLYARWVLGGHARIPSQR